MQAAPSRTVSCSYTGFRKLKFRGYLRSADGCSLENCGSWTPWMKKEEAKKEAYHLVNSARGQHAVLYVDTKHDVVDLTRLVLYVPSVTEDFLIMRDIFQGSPVYARVTSGLILKGTKIKCCPLSRGSYLPQIRHYPNDVLLITRVTDCAWIMLVGDVIKKFPCASLSFVRPETC